MSLAQSAIPNLAAEWAALKPRLAHHWPFELDVFQKQAVWHLERVRRAILNRTCVRAVFCRDSSLHDLLYQEAEQAAGQSLPACISPAHIHTRKPQ